MLAVLSKITPEIDRDKCYTFLKSVSVEYFPDMKKTHTHSHTHTQ